MKNHKTSRHRLHPDNMFPPHPDIIGECDNCHKHKDLSWYGSFGYLCLECMKLIMAEEELKKGNPDGCTCEYLKCIRTYNSDCPVHKN